MTKYPRESSAEIGRVGGEESFAAVGRIVAGHDDTIAVSLAYNGIARVFRVDDSPL